MSDCINCQCEEIVPGKTACDSLKKQNNDRIKLHSLVLRDTTLCDLPEQTSKAFYSQWCFNKKCYITAVLVRLTIAQVMMMLT